MRRTDDQIESAIEKEFFWSPFFDGDGIHVSVDAGEATLTGTVDSLPELEAASENGYQGGAAVVHNRLVVRGSVFRPEHRPWSATLLTPVRVRSGTYRPKGLDIIKRGENHHVTSQENHYDHRFQPTGSQRR